MVTESEPERPPESVTEAVMVWLPTDRELVEKEPPEPMAPSMLEVQLRDEVRLPSSVSLAVPLNDTLSPSV